MTQPVAARSLDELTLGVGVKLEDLLDREGLSEMLHSVYDLFQLPLRVFSDDGRLLSDVGRELELYAYLANFRAVRSAVDQVIGQVKSCTPGAEGFVIVPCVTGAEYRVAALEYDGRRIGRLVIGPYRNQEQGHPAASLFALDDSLDRGKVYESFELLPRAKSELGARVAQHLSRVLDLVLFSEHRALLTSNMHLASVRESFRDLEDKNQRLQIAYDRLKELDRLKSNFLATVSHELRTPLTSIIGYSEMLTEGLAGDLTDEQREFIQTIREKGEQLLSLIKGLLDLSKFESGTMTLRKNNTEVAKVVGEVISTMQPSALKKDVRLEQSVESGLPRIWADPERLRQILLNLCENAVKFTPAGGRVLLTAKLTSMDALPMNEVGGMVLLGTRRTGVEFRVADTGIGIPELEREKVFQAFYQVDSSSTREQGGTGLGLSIVKRLVEGHDGQIRIESNEPNGSVFVVTIPVKRATIG
ncbi:MAG TPA: HAMP domain-containing sensor histidine kinase [Polyangiaceae bacterium]|nr:HAMP domain-containing sensor histidine kinase [Polyangiaceae bacterium]